MTSKAGLLIGLFLADSACTVLAQTSGPGRVWTRFRGSALMDNGRAAAVDSRSNVYVCGHSPGEFDGQTNKGQALVKWTAAGEWVWTRTFGGPAADASYAVAVDTQDSVYVCGQSGGDFDGHVHPNPGTVIATLIKFNSDGVKQWSDLFGSDQDGWAYDVACDTNLNVYVVGGTCGPFDGQPFRGADDAFIRKWDRDGNLQWTRLWGTNGTEGAWGLAIFGSNIFVGGETSGPFDGQSATGGMDVFVSLWRADGTRAWTQIFGTLSNDYVKAMQGNSGDAFCMAGHTWGTWSGQTNHGSQDAMLLTFDREGTLRWVRMFGGTNSEYTSGVAMQGGSIYVSGLVLPGSSWGGEAAPVANSDIFLEARKGNGATNWTRFWGSTNSDSAGKMAADPDGAVYVSGTAWTNYDGQVGAGDRDIAVSRYEPAYQVQTTNLSLAGSSAVLHWRGAYDWRYSLLECADLAAGTWTPVAGQTNLSGCESMCATGTGGQVRFWHPRALR